MACPLYTKSNSPRNEEQGQKPPMSHPTTIYLPYLTYIILLTPLNINIKFLYTRTTHSSLHTNTALVMLPAPESTTQTRTSIWPKTPHITQYTQNELNTIPTSISNTKYYTHDIIIRIYNLNNTMYTS